MTYWTRATWMALSGVGSPVQEVVESNFRLPGQGFHPRQQTAPGRAGSAARDMPETVRLQDMSRRSRSPLGMSGCRLWEISDIVQLVEDAETKPGKRGPYKKRAEA